MGQKLLIVESPAKAKTIEKYLGKDFVVKSSFGHVRDLEKGNNAIDVDNNFTPHYVITPDKVKVVKDLKDISKKSEEVWLATDEDREGEAISWHLCEVLGLNPHTTKRIVFREITKPAIQNAVANPRNLDLDLVNAQQARRVLDRLVGFELSEVLWRKIKASLSAGRVQSVAVRLVVDREREINNFEVETFFRVKASFPVMTPSEKTVMLVAESDQKFKYEKDAYAFLEKCIGTSYHVQDITVKPGTRKPAPPFTTSTLQQEASRKLGFGVNRTMSAAQKLYEAGFISYMRTDSTNLSKLALAKSREVILETFGENYSKTRQFKTKSKGAQEAHEAIRPAYPDKPEITGTKQEKMLYDLIWKRTVASQMADAKIERTSISIDMNNSPAGFTATGEVIIFDGFLRVYSESADTDSGDDERYVIPPVKNGMKLVYDKINAQEKFTLPPPRYTEASLVKKLEELGIGRPSTYAPTISTIQNRGYVSREDRPGEKRKTRSLLLEKGKISSSSKTELAGREKSKLFPKDIGMIVNDFLVENFKDIVDFNFTADVEEQFDEIALGSLKWTGMLKGFYTGFHKTVENTLEKKDKKTGVRVLGTHPETGESVSVKMGRFGPVVQIGESNNGNKPKFASLMKDQLIETITFDDALKLFRLPRSLGMHEGEEMVVGIGKFGPYVRYAGKFYSLKKGVDDPYSVTIERALELIQEKNDTEKQKVIHDFGTVKVVNGRYGPYITSEGKNYRIPKGTDPAKLSADDCKKIIEGSNKSGK